jgi:hypothetical protein
MTYSETIQELNEVDLQKFSSYSADFAKSFFVMEDKGPTALVIKENLLDRYIEFLNYYITEETLPREKKIYWINFLDKLTLQREILAIEKGELDLKAIQKASLHLGKKMQSSFSDPK